MLAATGVPPRRSAQLYWWAAWKHASSPRWRPQSPSRIRSRQGRGPRTSQDGVGSGASWSPDPYTNEYRIGMSLPQIGGLSMCQMALFWACWRRGSPHPLVSRVRDLHDETRRPAPACQFGSWPSPTSLMRLLAVRQAPRLGPERSTARRPRRAPERLAAMRTAGACPSDPFRSTRP